jgi:hypothetical protein
MEKDLRNIYNIHAETDRKRYKQNKKNEMLNDK